MAKRYEEEFKKQIVALFNNDKSLADINREYGVAKSTIKEWIERYNKTESFNVDDNRTEEEKELIKFKKRCKELEMENGYYIGSGPIESGNKVVIQQRMKQSGMRWGVSGGQYIATLRAKYESDLWNDVVEVVNA